MELNTSTAQKLWDNPIQHRSEVFLAHRLHELRRAERMEEEKKRPYHAPIVPAELRPAWDLKAALRAIVDKEKTADIAARFCITKSHFAAKLNEAGYYIRDIRTGKQDVRDVI